MVLANEEHGSDRSLLIHAARPFDTVNERDALRALAVDLPHAGDDAAVVGDTVITTDMLHEQTDFPPGTTRYTAGWRAVGASLSDIAAMGADATAAVAVYADADAVYVTFDIDSVDPSVAPGTGTPEPGGLSASQALAVMETIGTQDSVGAVDLMEVSPTFDPTDNTSRLGAYLLTTVLEQGFA